MKKRYKISQSKCKQGLVEFYKCAAEISGLKMTSKSVFDCRKICVTKPVQDSIWRYYSEYKKQSDEEIATVLLHCGPKANLDGETFEFEIEDGFVSEGD